MTVVYPTSSSVVAGVVVSDTGAAISIADGDLLVVDGRINLVSTTDTAISFGGLNLRISLEGDVVGNANGIVLDLINPAQDLLFDYRVSLGQTGSVTGNNYGIYAGSSDHTSARLGSISIDNAGAITSFQSTGVLLTNALNAVFSNSGSVASLSTSPSFANAVYINNVNNVVFENTGEITNWLGHTSGGVGNATVAFNGGIQNVTGINAGLITGSRFAVVSTASVSESFTNSGVIQGIVSMSPHVGGFFNNSGKVFGDIFLDTGADTFDGRGGWVEGDVNGGLGDDLFIVDDAAISLVEISSGGTDTVRAATSWTLGDNFENLDLIGAGNFRGAGNALVNTITGNAGDNRLSGKGDKDTISGGDGDDLILGGGGRDTLNGDDGDDTLRGGGSKDTLYGGTGDDTLRGGQSDDSLFGDAGNDVLIGGLGTDTMTGGDGRDVFVFSRKAESLRGNPNDSITDFVIGEDRVDLSGLQPALSYIGSGAFSGTGGEVQVTLSGGNSIVKVDVDGDGTWDMKIVIDAVTGLSGADFIL